MLRAGARPGDGHGCLFPARRGSAAAPVHGQSPSLDMADLEMTDTPPRCTGLRTLQAARLLTALAGAIRRARLFGASAKWQPTSTLDDLPRAPNLVRHDDAQLKRLSPPNWLRREGTFCSQSAERPLIENPSATPRTASSGRCVAGRSSRWSSHHRLRSSSLAACAATLDRCCAQPGVTSATTEAARVHLRLSPRAGKQRVIGDDPAHSVRPTRHVRH